jgi:hypothetical protein
MFDYLATLLALIKHNIAAIRENPDGGYTTETVIVTGILVGLAVFALGDIIYNKVVNKANGINLG